MNLTKNDREIADRYISKRERQMAQWPYRRWLMLAIIAVFTMLGYRSVSDGMRSIHDEKTIDFYVSSTIGEAPPAGQEQRWAVGRMLKIAKLLEDRQQEMAFALMEVAMGYLEILLGVTLLCLTALRWNMGERDALICKLLREKLRAACEDSTPISKD